MSGTEVISCLSRFDVISRGQDSKLSVNCRDFLSPTICQDSGLSGIETQDWWHQMRSRLKVISCLSRFYVLSYLSGLSGLDIVSSLSRFYFISFPTVRILRHRASVRTLRIIRYQQPDTIWFISCLHVKIMCHQLLNVRILCHQLSVRTQDFQD